MRECLLAPSRLVVNSCRGVGWENSYKSGHIFPELDGRKPTHIVVGAGSAGCVLAARLSEDPSNRVLLLEAGPRDHRWDFRLHMPAALMSNLSTHTYNWFVLHPFVRSRSRFGFYHTIQQENLNSRVIYWPRGRVWGGSSSLNAMCYVRGHPFDYDRWEKEGAEGWAFKNCLPYFKRSESYVAASNPSDPYRGDRGPLRVRRGECSHPLHKAWLEVGKVHSIGFTEDMNGFKQEGISRMDMTINDDGSRCSASRAFLWPILSRPNLHVSSGITCTRVLFEKKRAIGVEFIRRLQFLGTSGIDSYSREKVYCEDAVVLAGGAVNTPHLLLVSGVGNASHLRAHDIDVVLDLPGVGSNLQDHVEVYVQQRCLKPITLYGVSSWKFPHRMVGLEWLLKGTGLGASSHLESGGFARSRPDVPHPDIQFHFLPGTVHDDGRTPGTCHAFQVHVGPMRSKSKGLITLGDKDPRRAPIINPKYMSAPEDWVEFRKAVRLSRELFATKPFDEFRGTELAPGDNVQSDEQIDEFVRKMVASAYHPSCTCRMGRAGQEGAVVDPLTMGVHGLEGLKVADASVMPSIVSGNLNAPVYMIAEKASDIILGKKSLPPESPPMSSVDTKKSLPIFDLSDVAEKPGGWGPSGVANTTTEGASIPFQQFSKADRIGRVADWIGVMNNFYRRGNERLYGSAANAGSQFDYVHEMDDNNFQLVDSSRPVQRSGQRNFRTRQLQFRKLIQKEQERKEQAQYGRNQKMMRSIAKEQQRAYKQWQRRGGGARAGGRGAYGGRFGERGGPKDRAPSVNVRPEWSVLEEIDLPRLVKLTLPGVGSGEDINGHRYGVLYYYEKAIDRVSVKNPLPLQRCGGTFYSVTTTEDPVMEKLASEGAGNVFATDIILATLMAAPRSVYSWDIVAHRVGDKLFFDKRDTGGFSNPVDALTVSETANEPPTNDLSSMNNAKDLATEALYINQNFRRQVLKRSEEPFKFEHEHVPFEEEVGGGDTGCAYKYRKFTLGVGEDGKPVEVVVRTEHDGAIQMPNGEVQTLTIKAFNEWDSSQSGGVDWRSKLESQKGGIFAAELKNNNCKLAKWTLQAILANSDHLKFGYVSRANVRNSAQHVILGTHQVQPASFATSFALNIDNAWGILRFIIDSCMRQPPGKYLLLKDPITPVLRLYSLPPGTFESDNSDSDDDSEESSGDEQ